jgi:hypothetical protein
MRSSRKLRREKTKNTIMSHSSVEIENLRLVESLASVLLSTIIASFFSRRNSSTHTVARQFSIKQNATSKLSQAKRIFIEPFCEIDASYLSPKVAHVPKVLVRSHSKQSQKCRKWISLHYQIIFVAVGQLCVRWFDLFTLQIAIHRKKSFLRSDYLAEDRYFRDKSRWNHCFFPVEPCSCWILEWKWTGVKLFFTTAITISTDGWKLSCFLFRRWWWGCELFKEVFLRLSLVTQKTKLSEFFQHPYDNYESEHRTFSMTDSWASPPSSCIDGGTLLVSKLNSHRTNYHHGFWYIRRKVEPTQQTKW